MSTSILADGGRRIQRGLTPVQRQRVFELGLEGLSFNEETRRLYPQRGLAAHVLGFTDVDGNGIAGIEYALDERLTQSDEPLRLTIDAGVQYSLETELEAAAISTHAQGGAGIVLDAQTGHVSRNPPLLHLPGPIVKRVLERR